jgi:hypothetical protein
MNTAAAAVAALGFAVSLVKGYRTAIVSAVVNRKVFKHANEQVSLCL